MDEAVFYVGQGDPQDKHSLESYGFVLSLHTAKQFQSFRNADCSRNGAHVTLGNRVFVASSNKALINVYVYGKESIDQRMPIPEPVSCLDILEMNPKISNDMISETNSNNLPNYKVPYLLVGGTKTGKVYIWELLSGNLIFAKDFHYQAVTKVKFSECGTFLVSCSEDSRCLVFKTIDLISNNQEETVKPFLTVNDHTLPVTDFCITRGLINDINLITVSKDCTLRLYNIMTKQLINTMVFLSPLNAIVTDPSYRNFYAAAGEKIQIVSMFKLNNLNLERIGKFGEIITVNETIDNQILIHSSPVTQLAISLDGMNLVSGDDEGNVYVSEINSKLVLKSFQLNSAISHLQVMQFPITQETIIADKKTRLLPPLKRIINDNTNKLGHEFYYEIPNQNSPKHHDIEAWINEKAAQEIEFKVSNNEILQPVKDDGKLERLSLAYSDLKSKYDELLKEHKQLLNQ